MTLEQRKERAKAANNALRGGKQPIAGRIKRAIGLESTGYEQMIGFGEKEFSNLLTERGIKFVWQKAVHIYSLDFAIGNVAVELKAGNSGYWPDVLRNRVKNLSELGWRILYVCFDSTESLLGNFEYIISNVDRLNREPAAPGKYWVIRSRIDRFTRFRNDQGQFSAIPSAPKLFASCREFYF
jgi:very-short-patch-repair endonuclease